MKKAIVFISLMALFGACQGATQSADIVTGAANTQAYLHLLEGKRVGVLTNHTALIGTTHLVDSLLSLGVNVTMIFAPEHGFRGKADAGDAINNDVDAQTGIPIISVYGGKKYRPADSLMQQLDVAVFDIQDVGLRFYTYLSSLYYFMEACARNQVPLIVLDRPNPNGHIVSGPILDTTYRSFVGIVPVPVVHGMTLGEMAGMINRKHWLPNAQEVQLTVAPCLNYTHHSHYTLPVKPSPNLPNNRAIYLYPSLCPFEATVISLGRGTDFPFQVYGHPSMDSSDFTFTPKPVDGAMNPPQKGNLCYGVDLRTQPTNEEIWEQGFSLQYVIDAYTQWYRNTGLDKAFFLSNFFEKLVGVSYIRPMILEGKTAAEIAACWQDELEAYKLERKQYIIYPE